MPIEWLHVLLHEKTVNKDDCLYKLKYVYTVEDVYDILEFLSVQDYFSAEAQKKLESNKNANR